MKLHYLVFTYLIIGNLNIMAADQEQPSAPTHHRSPTGVVRDYFDRETTKLQLEEDVNMCVNNGDENELYKLREKHKQNKSLEGIVTTGIERCKKGKTRISDVSEKDLKATPPQPSEVLQRAAAAPQPAPSSPASDARIMHNWVAGGFIAGVAIVVAVVCYFKWMRPAITSH